MSEAHVRKVAETQNRNLDRELLVLSDWIRDTDSFSQVVARWLQSPVDYMLLSQSKHEVNASDAAALELAPKALALHRDGLLQSTLSVTPVVLASVRATVVEERLPWRVRRELEAGSQPLGAVLARHNVRRHTHEVKQLCGGLVPRAEHGEPVLRVRATLTTAGKVVATVDEVVYRSLFDRGNPAASS